MPDTLMMGVDAKDYQDYGEMNLPLYSGLPL
jgi:hypothetical protein